MTIMNGLSTGSWLTYPSEKYEFVSWDDDIPNWMESHKIYVPNHQPVYIITWKWMIDGYTHFRKPPICTFGVSNIGGWDSIGFWYILRFYMLYSISHASNAVKAFPRKNLGHQRWEFLKTNRRIFQQQKQGMIFLKPTTGDMGLPQNVG